MIKASVHNLVGILIDDSYPWVDTLFINNGVALFSDSEYDKCKSRIVVKKVNKLDISDSREVGEGMLVGNDFFIDRKYGVRIKRKASEEIELTVTQECNEWLIICVQILLLEQDATLIHGAAMEKDNKVLLLPSWGGVGKTATVITMVKEGWRLLGDDLVILKDNYTLPFLKPFVIYPYHKNLFPEIFQKNRNKIVKNIGVSNYLSKMIPSIKRILRLSPSLLALARKHNPQSMRISPNEIFDKCKLSDGGIINRIVWLERITSDEISFSKVSYETIISKAAAVTLLEVFADRMNCIYTLCGSGLFDYNDIFVKMRKVLEISFQRANCYELDIPVSITIDEVGQVVASNSLNSL